MNSEKPTPINTNCCSTNGVYSSLTLDEHHGSWQTIQQVPVEYTFFHRKCLSTDSSVRLPLSRERFQRLRHVPLHPLLKPPFDRVQSLVKVRRDTDYHFQSVQFHSH